MRWFSLWSAKRSKGAAARRPEAARLQLETLEERQVPTVNYYGGNLLPHVEAQALYLGNSWSGLAAPNPNMPYLDAVLKDITSGTGAVYLDALTRAGYNVGRGSASAGGLDRTSFTPGTTITDAYIQSEIKADIANGTLQAWDSERLYVVYVQPDVAINLGGGQGTTQQGILGYHGAFAGANGATIRYAVVAYPGGAAGNSSLGTSAIDQLTDVTSHELAEAVTDPDVNYAQLGWYDPRRGEIGDITESNPAARVRLDGYLVQEVADQNDQLLSIAASQTPTPTPTPAPAPTTVATRTTLTAGNVVRQGVRYPTVKLTITVTPASGTALPGGVVDLVYNGQVLAKGSVQVVNGVAQVAFSVQFGGSGNYGFSAVYVGSGSFQGSTSNTVTVTV